MRRLKKKSNPGFAVLRGFYIFTVILSALIVGGFCAYQVLVKPPEMQLQASNLPSSQENDGQKDVEEENAANDEGLARKDGVYTFLLFGMDDGNGNTDTIMVGNFDTVEETLHMVSIPRDTLIETTRSNKRINAVYALDGGAQALEGQVSALLGIPIDFYICINLDAFVAIVDAIGHVEYNVPMNMYYNDPTQGLYINLKKGVQKLNGEQALQLVRCRNVYASQDIGRVSTQQGFLAALASQTLRAENLSKVPKFAEIFSKYIDTDLKLENIIWLGEKLLSLDTETDLTFETIPFNSSNASYQGGQYVSLDIDGVLSLVNEKLNPYETDRTLSDLDIISIVNKQVVFSRDSGI